MPKLHDTPSREGFIIAPLKNSTKPTSKVVSQLFKKIFSQISSFHQKSTFYYINYNRFCVVQNSYPLIEKMNTIYSKEKSEETSTFDCSTLHANLPLQDLIRVTKIDAENMSL